MLRPEALVEAAQRRDHSVITRGVSQLKLSCGGCRATGGISQLWYRLSRLNGPLGV